MRGMEREGMVRREAKSRPALQDIMNREKELKLGFYSKCNAKPVK